jgi:hypothetical protein
LYVSPSTRKALEALATLLLDYHYSAHAIGRIAAYAAANGTPTGCAYLDREDEADATEVFVAELGPVDYDSPAWAREDVFLDVELLAAGTHPAPFGEPDLATLISHEAPDGPAVARKLMDAGLLPPLAGGAPDDEWPAFTPTAEDLADYAAWAEECDRREELRAAEERRNPEFGYE